MRPLFFIFLYLILISPVYAKGVEDTFTKSEPIAAPLERVIDGDTFISFNQRIRLWGIDAPEKDSRFYLASKLYLEVLLEKEPFSCHYKYKDRYKRLVMQCFSKGEDIARMMVQMGLAKDYFKYSKGEYAADESFAKDNSYGIWSK